MQKLWNRNFTILTLGSFVSALGSAAANVAFGILIYIETESPLMLAIFSVVNILPRLVTTFLVGPFIDRNSRVKIIYLIDFFYFVFFTFLSIILFRDYFNIVVFTIVGGALGVVDTVYQIAYMSLFPEVIEGKNNTQAYSISSLIWPISAAIMAPIAAYLIDNIAYGIAILMTFNAVTFLVTAIMETTIKVKEHLNTSEPVKFKFLIDLKEGFRYYKHERGILGIALLFMVFSFVYSISGLLRMPFFIEHDVFTIQHFSYLVSAGAIGRIIGGLIHYRYKLPKNKKYLIAVTVYFTVEILSAITLLSPYILMIVFSFIVGLLSVTSFNIRMSATQTYVQSSIRGRVNSVFQLLWSFGAIIGFIVAGLVAEYTSIGYEYLILSAAAISIPAILLIPVRMRKDFEKIYNVDV
ncbi:MFS transporter [Candidatus Izemoplasma sp. B36]|uniref:MFS transporter n=1 Tax=Candidatus Izemoplasma sp. B36 TaxID=3242468 RepID=UPI0035586137